MRRSLANIMIEKGDTFALDICLNNRHILTLY
jgi:hypothetical protein